MSGWSELAFFCEIPFANEIGISYRKWDRNENFNQFALLSGKWNLMHFPIIGGLPLVKKLSLKGL